MPWIIDYPIIVEQLRGLKLRSVYFNGGAFAFAAGVPTRSVGWIGPPDDSIKPEFRALVRHVPQPYEQNLTNLLLRAWKQIVPGRIWMMPASHWAYELEHGCRQWMPALLEAIGVDPGLLQGRTSASAIEFAPEESAGLVHLVSRLLQMLQDSDFYLAFPRWPVICMLHHHKQLWWTSAQDELSDALEALPAEG